MPGQMTLGISPFASTRAGVLAVAALAVEAGIETLWMGDGLLVNDAFPAWSGAMEPFTTLAWLSGRLPGARLGVSAAVLPLRDVVWTAKQAATLDQLSEGRFVLAVAPGFWAHELAFRGVDPTQRGQCSDGRSPSCAPYSPERHPNASRRFPTRPAVRPSGSPAPRPPYVSH
jgi:alkanesulfonate monooxygenase SsuD/methylene tetrahydromethanopterin reductase-like flavin-dependent oxidoreductase (luciferase family)